MGVSVFHLVPHPPVSRLHTPCFLCKATDWVLWSPAKMCLTCHSRESEAMNGPGMSLRGEKHLRQTSRLNTPIMSCTAATTYSPWRLSVFIFASIQARYRCEGKVVPVCRLQYCVHRTVPQVRRVSAAKMINGLSLVCGAIGVKSSTQNTLQHHALRQLLYSKLCSQQVLSH